MTLEMIKWEHSIFALPFALTAAMLATTFQYLKMTQSNRGVAM